MDGNLARYRADFNGLYIFHNELICTFFAVFCGAISFFLATKLSQCTSYRQPVCVYRHIAQQVLGFQYRALTKDGNEDGTRL